MRGRSSRVHFGSSLVLLVGLAVVSSRFLVAEELPADLKLELQDLQGQMARVEAQMTRIDASKVEQSIREVSQWVNEFSLDAELLDDNPLLVSLNKRIEELNAKAKTAAQERMDKMAKMNAMPGATDRPDINSMMRLKVDLNNVSFKKDVAPIIAEVCMGCHNTQRKSGDFDASTFTSFTTMIEPGNPDASHVLNLVTGKEEPRMPRGGQTTFTEEWVNIWTAWIKQGAKFDGTNKTAPLPSYMIDLDTQRRQLLAGMSTEDLEKIHRVEADRHIAIVSPKKPAHFYQTPNVMVYTTLSENDAEYAAWLAEATLEELKQAFGLAREPIFRGRLGVNVFADRFDYLAFAQEVDAYTPESDQYGHARLRPEYQYVAVAADQKNYELDGVVAEQVTTAFLRQLGKRQLPDWAVYGFSRRFAADMEGRKKSIALRDELVRGAELAASGKDLTGVLQVTSPWVETAPISASFFEFARKTDAKKTVAFLKELAESGNWGGAMTNVFGSNPQAISQTWAAWARKK